MVQTFVHNVCPVAHDELHLPATHSVVVPLQAVPHLPQLAGSLFRFAQVVPHSDCPTVQVTAHLLLTQFCPVAHAVPQAPQFELSLVRLTQVVPQRVWPLAH